MAGQRQFGVIYGATVSITGQTAAGIVVNSFEKSESVEKATARNEQGKVTDTKAYSKTTSISIRGKLDVSLATFPVTAGNTIVISGSTYMIDSVTATENNTDFADVAITASKQDSTTLTVYS